MGLGGEKRVEECVFIFIWVGRVWWFEFNKEV